MLLSESCVYLKRLAVSILAIFYCKKDGHTGITANIASGEAV
jgi:hypothetical protein